MEWLTNAWDWLCGVLQSALEWVVNLLPDSPFRALDTSAIAPYLKWVNWVIPLNFAVSLIESWLLCVGVYYIYSVVLRWIKAIQ